MIPRGFLHGESQSTNANKLFRTKFLESSDVRPLWDLECESTAKYVEKGCPYYHLVPKDLAGNLAWRSGLIEASQGDPQFQHDQWMMCARDLLYYINSYVWTYDPKGDKGCYAALPFITYPFQDPVFCELSDAIGQEDVGGEKSRDMGLSWMYLALFEWRWHFHDLQAFLLVSRNENLVDKTDEPDCLFWKIDFIHRYQPGWLLPNLARQKMSLANHDNQSTITGSSTTSDTSRGGRKLAVLLDEFAAVPDGQSMKRAARDVTNSIFYNSTPQGAANAFAQTMLSGIKRFTLHWSVHPAKARGLYTSEAGRLVQLDKHVFEEGYPFVLDGKLRSLWYDQQCIRASSDRDIAQELDIDYHGSDYTFFDVDKLEKHMVEHSRPPVFVGDLDYNPRTLSDFELVESEKGPLRLWFSTGMRSPTGEYVAGCDVSAGTGASNSVISVVDCQDGSKVLEYANPYIDPLDFGEVAVAICKFMHGARLVWEANGPGRSFGKSVIAAGYRNIYYRTDETRLGHKSSDIPGWWATADSKRTLLTEYRDALHKGRFKESSKVALRECRYYIRQIEGNKIVHSGSASTDDPSGAKDNHGDRVVASALCCMLMGQSSKQREKTSSEPPVGSMLHRRKAIEDRKKAVKAW